MYSVWSTVVQPPMTAQPALKISHEIPVSSTSRGFVTRWLTYVHDSWIA